jgi:hypothetical protein
VRGADALPAGAKHQNESGVQVEAERSALALCLRMSWKSGCRLSDWNMRKLKESGTHRDAV